MEATHTGLAISIRQPWAEQVLTGEKTEEYRSKPTHVRGRIYIYASLTPDTPEAEDLPRGVVIGEATLYDCREDEYEYAWLLKDPVRWDMPREPTQRANPVWFRPWGEHPASATKAPASDIEPGAVASPAHAPAGQSTPLVGIAVGAAQGDEPAGAPQVARDVNEQQAPAPGARGDLWEQDDPICVIRQFFAEQGPMDRVAAITGLARHVGYGRTGSVIAERIGNSLRMAVRRGVLQNTDGLLTLGSRSLNDLDRDHLKAQFCASLGRQWVDRDDAIREFARWMGFRRTGSAIDETCRSLIRGLLREGRLEAGGQFIRRT